MASSYYTETEILVRAVRGKRVLFLTHVRPDWDTLASAFALTQFFSPICTPTFGVVEKPDSHHAPFFAHFSPKVKVIDSLEDYDTLVCVDFRTPLQAGPLAGKLEAFTGTVVVLDHHHPSPREFPARAKFLLRPASVAAAQMVAQIGREREADFSKPVATALAVALLTDSVRFLVGDADTFSTMDFLLRASGKSYEALLDMANPPLSLGSRLAVLKDVRNTSLYEVGDYLLAVANHPYHGSLAANALVQLGADVGVGVFAGKEGIFCTVRVSTRAHDVLKFDAMKALLPFAEKNEGSAGGHARAAQLTLPPYFSESLVRDFFQRVLLERVRVKDKSARVRKR